MSVIQSTALDTVFIKFEYDEDDLGNKLYFISPVLKAKYREAKFDIQWKEESDASFWCIIKRIYERGSDSIVIGTK